MPFLIPLRNDLPFFEVQAHLEDVTYTLSFRWNVRAAAAGDGGTGWFLDVLDETGQTMILAGLRVVADWPLGRYNTGRKPPGVFFAETSNGDGIDPGLNDFVDPSGAGRVRFLYFTAAELGI